MRLPVFFIPPSLVFFEPLVNKSDFVEVFSVTGSLVVCNAVPDEEEESFVKSEVGSIVFLSIHPYHQLSY